MPNQAKFPKFPETLYVTQGQDGDNEVYYVAHDDPTFLAERSVAIPAAEYKLVRNGVVIEMEVTVK